MYTSILIYICRIYINKYVYTYIYIYVYVYIYVYIYIFFSYIYIYIYIISHLFLCKVGPIGNDCAVTPLQKKK